MDALQQNESRSRCYKRNPNQLTTMITMKVPTGRTQEELA
jgi:hypothetical protein